MKLQNILVILSILFIISGFGMTHATPTVALIGNTMLGVGCLYLIYVLYRASKNKKE